MIASLLIVAFGLVKFEVFMNKFRFLFLCVCALNAPSVFSKDCESSASNMAELRSCGYDESFKAVSLAYTSSTKIAKSKGEDVFLALEDTQKKWLKFRDSTCSFVRIFPSDTNANDASFSCHLDFNAARVKLLNQYSYKLLNVKPEDVDHIR